MTDDTRRFLDSEYTRRGDRGEELCVSKLREHNWLSYKPTHLESHPADYCFINENNFRIFVADIKTKPRRIHFVDTGIDIRHWKKYISISKHVCFALFFVDITCGMIYYNTLDNLELPYTDCRNITYPLDHNGIRYYSLDSMISLCKLTEHDQLFIQGEQVKK